MGFSHALFEVLVDAITAAGSTDGAAVDEAVGTLSVDTIVGPLDFTSGPYPNTASSPLVGGQWVKGTDFPYDLVVVSNSAFPGIPVAGSVEPLG